ncbi:ABC transporter substrate-binding protein [Siminovitchia sp. 179-K 8D1 HS]|uniref:ABC transporter substrate-binding protein n=1 Tax=Siminovitchia sp. 179-K 8D1 HS TaxID=3142385 RepID=UPI0039A21829
MKLKWIAISMALLLLVASGCSQGTQKKSNEGKKEDVLTIKMAVQPWVGNGPFWIAEEKGIDEKYGIKLETVPFEQDSDMNAAFASDKVQVANLATHTTIRMEANQDLDMKAIIFMDESHDADAILADKSIQSVKDLKGQKIAFEEGATSELLLQQALSEEGMTLDEVETVFMPASQAGLSMISGDVKTAVTYAPYINEVLGKKQDEGVHLIYTGKDSPGLISDIVVGKTKFFEDNPEATEKLRKVWDEALQYWKENEEEGNKIVAEGSGITAEELPSILSGLKFYNSKEQAEKARSGELMEAAGNIQKLMMEAGSMKKEVNLEEIFDME